MELKIIIFALLFTSIVATYVETATILSYKETVLKIRFIEDFERSHNKNFLFNPYDWETNIPLDKDYHPDSKENTIYDL